MNRTANMGLRHRLQVVQNSGVVRDSNAVRNFYIVGNRNDVQNTYVVQNSNVVRKNQRRRSLYAPAIVHNTRVTMFAILISSPLWLAFWCGAG
jgi:hypothetical protein